VFIVAHDLLGRAPVEHGQRGEALLDAPDLGTDASVPPIQPAPGSLER